MIKDKFFNQAPMKYYQPTTYDCEKAKDIISNKGNNYIATQKSDGEWCRIIKDENGNTFAQSRNISKITGEYGDKTNLIPHIIEEFKIIPNGTVLLGELCFSEINSTSREVGTILRCLPAKAIERQKVHKLIFRVFDCLAYDNEDISNLPYIKRFDAALKLIKSNHFDYIELCNYTYENFEDFLQEILIAGGEGIVIHSKDYIYQPGGRPAWKTMKVKKITTEIELPIVSLINPKKLYEGKELENWKYWVGVYRDTKEEIRINRPLTQDDREFNIDWFPVTKPYYYYWINGVTVSNNGTLVKVTSGLTDADREWLATKEAIELLHNNQLYAVVSAMEITPDNSLRHPRLIRIRQDI